MVAGLFGGCSIHPVPDAVSGANTLAIVTQVRCEAKQALESRILTLAGMAAPAEDQSGTAPQRDEPKKLSPAALDRLARKVMPEYANGAIGYEFTFDIKEDNKNGVKLGLADPFSNGLLGIGLTADNNRSRWNTRNFLVDDNFPELVTRLAQETCGAPTRGTNWRYPMSGSIGVAEVIDTFLELNKATHLGVRDKVPTFADTLEFETTVSGSVDPTIAFTPVNAANRLILAGASSNNSLSRKDKHKVVIALNIAKPAPKKPTKAVKDAQVSLPTWFQNMIGVKPERSARPASRSAADPAASAAPTPAQTNVIRELRRQDEKLLYRRLEKLGE